MSRGRHLSLSEARKSGQLNRYAREHPSTGDAEVFDKLLEAMASGKKPRAKGTSSQGASGGSSGIQSRRGTSEDA